MYNKIASIILNIAKVQGSGDVYVSQPTSEMERIAGKLFVLAEINGKKAEIDKLLEFLITELEENYYSDEKIHLIGKVEGLKAENIFEAALAKTNKSLAEFLKDHKIKLDPSLTDITLGVIFGDKLHFSSFGKNRALLIYRREGGYEIINVDEDAKLSTEKEDNKSSNTNNLFSSVISGQVPVGSYFVFATESLPEYLSSRELVKIITKLPPIVAAEQMKNVLLKINNYVPFLGIIIKNTTDKSGLEIKDNAQTTLSAHNSISTLNYTEKKTESMLSPAGLINLHKTKKVLTSWFKPKKDNKQNKTRKEVLLGNASESNFPSQNKKTLNKSLNLPSASSFLRPPKVLLRKGSSQVAGSLKQFIYFIPNLFSPSFWRNFSSHIKSWFRNLNKKNIALGIGLIIVVIGFSLSLIISNINRNNEKREIAFNLAVTEIEEKKALIESYLLYENYDGASRVLSDIKSLITELPQEEEYQIEAYNELSGRLSNLDDKILRIDRISNMTEVANFSHLNLQGIIVVNDKIYVNSSNSIYSINISDDDNFSNDLSIGASALQNGRLNNDSIYYRNNDEIIAVETEDETVTTRTLANYNENENYQGFDLYESNNNLYLLSPTENQIFVYPPSLATRSNWLKENADLSQAVDIFIDGSIYVLNNNGQINKFHLGRAQEYSSEIIQPSTSSARKIVGDSLDVADGKLYILVGKNRLIILDKESGSMQSQYLFDNLNISDFSLTGDRQSVYLLSEGKIYLFPLSK